MSQTSKIILIVVGVLVVLCGCAAVASMVFGLIAINRTAQSFEGVEMAPGVVEVAPPPALEQVLPEVAEGNAEVKDAAAKIADFDLPAGYTPEYGMHMMGFDLVGFSSDRGHGHIMMMQFPDDVDMDMESMQEQMRQFSQMDNRNWNMNMEVIETKTMDVRGQEQTVTISEGTDGDGNTFRQMVTLFEGKSGPALLVMVAQISEWDQAQFEDFIGSLR